MLKIGFAKIDITPDGPVPMAGYVTKGDRLSERVGDPIYARALYLEEGDESVCLISVDLLLINSTIYDEVHRILSQKGRPDLKCFLHAQHTHSSFGGFWDNPPAKLFCGNYRPELFELLTNGLANAAYEASQAPREATLSFAVDRVPDLNENRRDNKNGPVDRDMTVIEASFAGSDDKICIVSFSAHPVIVAEKDNHRLSADFPGRLCEKLEQNYSAAMFFNGGVGATSIVFPESISDCDEHLEFVGEKLFKAATEIAGKVKSIEGDNLLHNQVDWMDRPKMNIRAFPDDWFFANLLTRPLTLWLQNFFGKAVEKNRFPLQNVKVGPLVFCGQPSDAGVSLALAIDAAGKELGFEKIIVTSQTNDYIGYSHLPEDYQYNPFSSHEKFLVVYENFMGYFGHEFGQEILMREKSLLADFTKET